MCADRALELIDVATMRGLEIGALNRPRVRKQQGPVFYVDHFSTEELRARYLANEQMRSQIDSIVDVDFVIRDGMSLAQCVGEAAPFDYVIGSHLIEHVPNPIGWLRDVASVLRPGGILSLIVPDKRYCFDCNRVETQMRDWVDWHMRDLHVPTYAQVYDFFANVVTIDGSVDTPGIWAGTVTYDGVRRPDVPDADRAALAMCLDHRERGEYVDVHGAVYSPLSFLRLLETTARVGLLDFEVDAFSSTAVNELEFFVGLRKTDRGSASEPALGRLRRFIDDEVAHIEEADPLRREMALRIRAEQQLHAMVGSRSWRVTRPLRYASRAVARFRRGVGAGP